MLGKCGWRKSPGAKSPPRIDFFLLFFHLEFPRHCVIAPSASIDKFLNIFFGSTSKKVVCFKFLLHQLKEFLGLLREF